MGQDQRGTRWRGGALVGLLSLGSILVIAMVLSKWLEVGPVLSQGHAELIRVDTGAPLKLGERWERTSVRYDYLLQSTVIAKTQGAAALDVGGLTLPLRGRVALGVLDTSADQWAAVAPIDRTEIHISLVGLREGTGFRLVVMGYNESAVPTTVVGGGPLTYRQKSKPLPTRSGRGLVLGVLTVWTVALIVSLRRKRRERHALQPEPGILAASAFWLPTSFAVFLFLCNYPTLIWDAAGYYQLALAISREGLLAFPSGNRTYGYPFFISLITGFTHPDAEQVLLIVFVVQLLVFLGVSAFASRRIGEVSGSRRLGRTVFWALTLNPLLLVSTTQCLTDSLSADLAFLAIVFSVPRSRPTAGSASTPLMGAGAGPHRTLVLDCFLAFASAGLSVMIRPPNLAVLVTIAVLWLWRGIRRRDATPRLVLVAFAALTLAFIPQLLINWKAHKRLHPLVVGNIYNIALKYGVPNLKYAGIAIPGQSPRLFYKNPFYIPEPSVGGFMRRHPARFALTLALHAFTLFDYDFLFTYITNLHPWYRWPVSIANYVFLFLVGIAALRTATRRRGPTGGWFAFWTGGAMLATAGYFCIYLPVSIETRYSLPLIAIWTPAAVVAGRTVTALARHRPRRTAWKVLAVGSIFVAACCFLSLWVAAQAPQLSGKRPVAAAPRRSASILKPLDSLEGILAWQRMRSFIS